MREKNFRIVSLLTLFTVALNILGVLFVAVPVGAITATSDTMSRLKIATNSSHTFSIALTGTPITGDTVSIDLKDLTDTPAGFDCTGLVVGDVTGLATDWLVDSVDAADCIVVLIADAAPATTVTATVAATNMLNPATAGSYDINISAVMDAGNETAVTSVAIVDDDQVTVNGYINTSLLFDIDTADTDVDCGANLTYSGGVYGTETTNCAIHAGGGAATPAGYVVDLGNLTTSVVNKSGDTRLHADSISGAINFVWFDINTNATNGAVVTVLSTNNKLDGPGANAYDIPAATAVVAGTPGYGIQVIGTPTAASANVPVASCSGGTYCDLSGAAVNIFTTGGAAVEEGRVQAEVAAAINGLMPAGTYTDTLTFIATATF